MTRLFRNKKVSIWLGIIGTLLSCLYGVRVFESLAALISGGIFLILSAVIGYWSGVPYVHYFEIDDWTEKKGEGFALYVPYKKHHKNHPVNDVYEKKGEDYEKVGVNDNYTNTKDVELISTMRFGGKVIIK